MSILNDRIKERRLANRLTLSEVAEVLGVKEATMQRYESGDIKNIKHETIGSLANIFGCSPAYLMGWEEEINCNKSIAIDTKNSKPINEIYGISPDGKKEELSNHEIDMLNRYRELDEHGKDMVDTVLEKEHDRTISERKVIEFPLQQQPDRSHSTLNLSELKVSAGTGAFLEEETMYPISVEFNRLIARADFAVPVDGNSMLPKYKDGDILLVHKQPAVNVGEIGIFVIDDLGYVKEQGEDRLISLNKNYDDIYLNENNYVKCCGKVIGILEPEWILEE